jgi:hypothetical protein
VRWQELKLPLSHLLSVPLVTIECLHITQLPLSILHGHPPNNLYTGPRHVTVWQAVFEVAHNYFPKIQRVTNQVIADNVHFPVKTSHVMNHDRSPTKPWAKQQISWSVIPPMPVLKISDQSPVIHFTGNSLYNPVSTSKMCDATNLTFPNRILLQFTFRHWSSHQINCSSSKFPCAHDTRWNDWNSPLARREGLVSICSIWGCRIFTVS